MSHVFPHKDEGEKPERSIYISHQDVGQVFVSGNLGCCPYGLRIGVVGP